MFLSFPLFAKMLVDHPSGKKTKTKQKTRNLKNQRVCATKSPPKANSLIFGLGSHVEGNQAVDGPSHSQRHGGPVKHLVGKASFQVDGHAVSLLEEFL